MIHAHVAVEKNINNVVVNSSQKPVNKGFAGFSLKRKNQYFIIRYKFRYDFFTDKSYLNDTFYGFAVNETLILWAFNKIIPTVPMTRCIFKIDSFDL